MQDFFSSIRSYESAMRSALGEGIVEADLAYKHELLAENPFFFLRGTCWRWAESASTLCPELTGATAVPSVGDAHAGNFGLWRDADLRLVWGINDYDEAAITPWPLDLVRLCASLVISGFADANDIAKAALAGYAEGLAAPAPFVLERDHRWLRADLVATRHGRARFWRRLEKAATVEPTDDVRDALLAALPGDTRAIRFIARRAGVGSLGKPRIIAIGEHRGGPVVAEAKAVLPSCWIDGRSPGLAERMASGPWRSPDPRLVYGAKLVVRRLAPNSHKLDFDEAAPRHKHRLIGAMAADIAAVHAGNEALQNAIATELTAMERRWLASAAARVARWTETEFRSWRTHFRSSNEPSAREKRSVTPW
ncbi:DUF2252 family protein [Flavisphingomonas formosensis]|uniref:DUF2252 family protein n=1 Tax=Flavisphingomonas formosensis TaxID=861534 RepID=UPI0012FB90F6|nr:DUF2252 family protein [Sphingomonas formosensis]